MAIHPILIWPDKCLKQPARPVDAVTDAERRLLDDMLETMYDAPGVGLAAPQIGISRRLAVIDIADKETEPPNPIRMINPEITWRSETRATAQEGCLSIPDQYADVTRPDAVTVRYLDENGDQQEISADGLLAICLQHELDHLDGIMFIDHLSTVKRSMLLRKFNKAQRARE